MPVDGGAGHAEDIRDLLDRSLRRVVELLSEDRLLRVEPGSRRPPLRPRKRAAASPSRVLAMISSRCSSASTESMPNIARPSAVEVSMPCSMTCRPTPRSRNSAPSVTRCRTDRPRRSKRVIFSVGYSRRVFLGYTRVSTRFRMRRQTTVSRQAGDRDLAARATFLSGTP